MAFGGRPIVEIQIKSGHKDLIAPIVHVVMHEVFDKIPRDIPVRVAIEVSEKYCEREVG